MIGLIRGLRGGLIGFFVIAALVVGGLGWATVSALRLERQQMESRLQGEHNDKVRLALWRLDSRVSPLLAREASRPYYHYNILYAPSLPLRHDGIPHQAGSVLKLSPLVLEDLADWMALHFQIDEDLGWSSPQVPPKSITNRLKTTLRNLPFRNVTGNRKKMLEKLQAGLPAIKLLATAKKRGGDPVFEDEKLGVISCYIDPQTLEQQGGQMPSQQMDIETQSRFSLPRKVANDVGWQTQAQSQGREIVYRNALGNGLDWLTPRLQQWKTNPPVKVSTSSLVPVWLTQEDSEEHLLLLRLVAIEQEVLCQGIMLNEQKLEQLLLKEIHDLFPNATLSRARKEVRHPERTMASLPFQLEPGPVSLQGMDLGWTPLRMGLILAWIAALLALAAVGLGGWSLLDLSERRFRFVSAVTHELRTPLTTLRLYLDLLLGNIVTEPEKRQLYLETLSQETERLHRLVTNVLAFSRLEKQKPKVMRQSTPATGLLEGTAETWQRHCEEVGKKLVLENRLKADDLVDTDKEMAQQILDNLIDNACKYSREAEDPCLWLRGWAEKDRIIFEVEDCGPGIPSAEQRTIFRAFRRGRKTGDITGGVGLGLSLAARWAELLGGKLTLEPGEGTRQGGACFRLELPAGEKATSSIGLVPGTDRESD